MNALVIGCGYLGLRAARRWAAAGRTVYALTRGPQRAKELTREGLRPIVGDVTRPETLADLPPAETVLWAVGYDPRGSASRRQVHVEGLRAVLAWLGSQAQRFLYISSTGVYGEADGRWVDEDSPCRPSREAGRVLLDAEEALRSHPLGARAIVLRLAGLYGPGRIPRLADLLAGRPIPVPASGHLNLIHVDDAVQAVLAAEARGRPPRTYVVSDGHPTRRREFYSRLAELLRLGPPRLVEMEPHAARAQRGGSDKRVRNTRLLAELDVVLQYPSYREGLAAIAAAMK